MRKYPHREIYYKKLANANMEAWNSKDLYDESANQTPMKTDLIQV